METLRKCSFFVLIILGLATTACAQTAEEIVAKNIQAVGGRDLISSVKSVVIKSNLSVNGMDAPTTTYILAGKGYKNETDFNGTKIVNCITNTGGWMINPMQGATSATAMPADAVKAAQGQLQIVPLSTYADNGGKLELLGKDTADYKVRLTNPNGFDGTFYINMKTYLLDKIETKFSMQGQSMDIAIRFSDYRKTVAGVLIPYEMDRDMGQMSMSITNKDVQINQAIDPSIFAMPK